MTHNPYNDPALRQLAIGLVQDSAANAEEIERSTLRECLEEDEALQHLAGAEQDAAVEALKELLTTAVTTVTWPEHDLTSSPGRTQPWPTWQRMPHAIVGQRMQPQWAQALDAYRKAHGLTPVAGSRPTCDTVNEAIEWWNERAGREQQA